MFALQGADCDAPTEPFPVDVSWSFIDDRPCDLAGVVDVFVYAGGSHPSRFRCVDGSNPDTVSVVMTQIPTTIVAEGRSVTGALLYRGEADLEESRSSLRITLRFVGGSASPR